MKKLAIFAVAAATLCATPVLAQGISIGPGGVRVDDGYRDRPYYRDRDFRDSRNEYRDDRRYRRDRDFDRRRGDRDRVYIERD